MGARVASRTYDEAADSDGVSLRCLAYALPLSLLCWTVIFFCLAAGSGYLKL